MIKDHSRRRMTESKLLIHNRAMQPYAVIAGIQTYIDYLHGNLCFFPPEGRLNFAMGDVAGLTQVCNNYATMLLIPQVSPIPPFSYDPDALAYFTTANITDPTAQQQINSFVVGVKSLGLWNSMVCWPLQSSQNASSTLTAQSLGGLGNYPATLTNFGSASSAWTSTGLVGSSVNSVATTTLILPSGNSSRTLVSVWQNYSASQFVPIGSTTADLNRFLLRSDNQTNASSDLYNGTTSYAVFGSTTVSSGVNFSAVTYNASNSAALFKANSNASTSATIPKSFGSGAVIFGAYSGSYGQGYGLFALNMALNISLTETQINNLNLLYKSTLGLGLALP